MKARILLLSLVASAFVACGNENVEKVKNSTLRGLDTMTIGAAIEGSKICADLDYKDTSKDGLKSVLIVCKEEPSRAKARYDKDEAQNNEYLARYISDFRRVVIGEISDDDIKVAARQFVTLEKTNKMFADHKFDKNGFLEFMNQKGLKYKNGRNMGWSNPLINIASALENAPKLPSSVVYELSFIIKPDGSVEPKRDELFVVIDGEKKAHYKIISEFYER